MNVNPFWFAVGLGVALIAAVLLFLDVIEPGIAAVIGIVGIGLIATSRRAGRGQN
jgi:hypothetical protein